MINLGVIIARAAKNQQQRNSGAYGNKVGTNAVAETHGYRIFDIPLMTKKFSATLMLHVKHHCNLHQCY